MPKLFNLGLLSGLTCLLALGVGLYVTPLAREAALKLGMVAKPDGRLRFHEEPVPYLGGVAIYIAMLVALTVAVDFNNMMLGILLGTTIILMVGLIDDFGVMTPGMKLFGQVVAAVALIKGGIVLELTIFEDVRWPGDLPLLSWGLSAVWLIGVANALNFLDIEDGLAAGVAACCCPALFLVAWLNGRPQAALFTAALFGGTLGFLRYNAPLPTARIYLGDAGSLLLGLSLASLAMIGSYTAANDLAVACPIIILGVPCFELGLTMAARWRRGVPVYYGSPDHVAKRLEQVGLGKRLTLGLHCGASLVLGAVAIAVMKADIRTAIIIVGALMLAALAAAFFLLRLKIEWPAGEDMGKQNETQSGG
ncbi:MAG TPA: MraY family glycosyltransferase [bacterium]|nr:MraY family glycosyltransferase [bacterium]